MMNKYRRTIKLLRLTTALAIIFALLSGFLIYTNYDYLAFKYLMTKQYIYTDTLDTVYNKYLETDPDGKYFRYFDDLVIALSTIGITFENKDRYTYLYIPKTYEAYKSYTKDKGLETEAHELDDDTVYMCLTNFSKYSLDMMEENLDLLKSHKNIIIDLRNNGGGKINVMRKIATYFLPKKSVIAKMQYRNRTRVYKSRKEQVLDFENIIILQGPNTASASENLIAALNDNLDNVTLIGQKTFGKGIGQLTVPLKDGYAVKATTLLWFSPKGENIHEKGIEPNVQYTGADIIEYATEYLKSK